MTINGKSILVATDLSARSDRAVDRATMLAAQWRARLTVLHAIEPGSKLETHPELATDAIRNVLPDPEADVGIVPAMGPVPAIITDAAASSECILIVTGVARYNSIGDYFVGTAVDMVVRHSTVPVLVVKQRPHKPYTSILVATDYSNCSRQALLTAARMFPDAAIHLVHAYHVPYEGRLSSDEARREIAQEEQEGFDAFIRDTTIPHDVRARISTHLDYGETDRVMWNAADAVGADLVVLGTHGRSGFIPAVLGSTAESLLATLPIDTLMVREQP